MADCGECGATSRWGKLTHAVNCPAVTGTNEEKPKKGKKNEPTIPPQESREAKPGDCPVCQGAKVVVFRLRRGFWVTRKCNACNGTGKKK